MKRPLLVTAAITIVAGCGGQSIEDRVKSEYPDYAKRHHIDATAQNVDHVTCTKEPTHKYDGWCRIRPKGFRLTYDVPYRGETVYWGESGLMTAPGG